MTEYDTVQTTDIRTGPNRSNKRNQRDGNVGWTRGEGGKSQTPTGRSLQVSRDP